MALSAPHSYLLKTLAVLATLHLSQAIGKRTLLILVLFEYCELILGILGNFAETFRNINTTTTTNILPFQDQTFRALAPYLSFLLFENLEKLL